MLRYHPAGTTGEDVVRALTDTMQYLMRMNTGGGQPGAVRTLPPGRPEKDDAADTSTDSDQRMTFVIQGASLPSMLLSQD